MKPTSYIAWLKNAIIWMVRVPPLLSSDLFYRNLIRLNEAERFFKETIELEKRADIVEFTLDAYFYLCDIMLTQKRFEEALDATVLWKKALLRFEERENIISNSERANLFTQQANIHLAMGELDKAEHALDSAEYYLPIDLIMANTLYRARRL